MLNDYLLSIFPISASAEHADGSFVVNVKPIEIKGEDIGIKPGIEKDSLHGKFRLMNGNIYRVINDEPPASHASHLLKLSEKIELPESNGGGNS